MGRCCCTLFDASRGSLYTALNTISSGVRATLGPVRACCHSLFHTFNGGIYATLYCLLHLYDDRRRRARRGLS